MDYKNQYRISIPFNQPVDGKTVPEEFIKPLNVYPPFLVKQINICISYVAKADVLPMYLVTSDITNNDLVGVLNRFSKLDANGDVYIADGYSNERVLKYIFKDYTRMPTSINLKFTETIGAAVASFDAVVHFEFLG